MRRRARSITIAAAVALLAIVLGGARPADAFSTAEGERELAAIESRWGALAQAPRRDVKQLAELDRRAEALASEASRSLAVQREDAAERDADMAAVVASAEWQKTEALLLKLRFRIAAIQLERALAGDPDRAKLAREAIDGFASFAEAPDPALAAEARYGRGLARLAAGQRAEGLADLRAAAAERSVAPRARLALAEALADGGDRTQALDVVGKQLAAGGMPRDLALRARLLQLRLLVAGGAKAASSKDLGPAVAELLAAGEPWRGSALGLLQGHEDLLPSGDDADPTVLLLRADAAARKNDALAALELYRRAVQRGGDTPSPAALDGLARTALAAGAFADAHDAVTRLRASGAPASRELALVDLRATYGLWQATPDAGTASALVAAADALTSVKDATADDRAEALFRKAEAARAAGDVDGAIAGFAAIDAPAWQTAASVAALQARVLRLARDPKREPRAALLRDLGAALKRDEQPADAQATLVVLDATVRTTPLPAGVSADALDASEQRAALARLRDFATRFPDSAALLPAVLRARALLELDTGGKPDTETLVVLDESQRPVVAAAIAGDLREELASIAIVAPPAAAASSGAGQAAHDGGAATASPSRDEVTPAAGGVAHPSRDRARRALAGALAFAELAPPAERTVGRLDLAQAALALGDAPTAVVLFRAEAEAKPTSLRALRGLALAAEASGDRAAAQEAWQRLGALPDLPPALREEVERTLGTQAAKPSPGRR